MCLLDKIHTCYRRYISTKIIQAHLCKSSCLNRYCFICNITSDNIRLDVRRWSTKISFPFPSKKQSMPLLTSDFCAPTGNCIYGWKNYIVSPTRYRLLNCTKSRIKFAHQASDGFCFLPLRHTRE